MQIPLKRGRFYTQQEATEMRHVVLVNEAFVKKNLKGANPLGQTTHDLHEKRERADARSSASSRDHKHLGLDTSVEPVAYWPHPELVYPGMTIVLRTTRRCGCGGARGA